MLPGATDAVLAWAVREGVTNVIRHSRAKHCEIRVTRRDEELRAQITDDGQGLSPERDGASAGSGLSGLTERVATFSGRVEAVSLPDGGFRLRVGLPAKSDAERSAWPEPKLDEGITGEDGRR